MYRSIGALSVPTTPLHKNIRPKLFKTPYIAYDAAQIITDNYANSRSPPSCPFFNLNFVFNKNKTLLVQR